MGAARQTEEGSVMPEEKRSLPPVKEFLEQMYGVKLEEPKPWTPEYRAKVVRKMEEYAREKAAQRGREKSEHGPEDI